MRQKKVLRTLLKDKLKKEGGAPPCASKPAAFRLPTRLRALRPLKTPPDESIIFYSSLSIKTSIWGNNFDLRIFFVFETVIDALRINKSAGFTLNAFAIFTSKSNEGVCRPHSIQPIVEVAQSQNSASCSCEIFLCFL